MRGGGLWVVAVLGLAACGDTSESGTLPAEVTAVERLARRRVVVHEEAAVAERAEAPVVVEPPVVVERLRAVDVDRLVAMLATTTGRHRRDVVYELVRRGPPEAAFETLIELTTDNEVEQDEHDDIAAVHALACFGDGALGPLRERLAALRGLPDNDDLRYDLEFAVEEIEWLFPHLVEPDTREPSSAGPPYVPSIERVREWLLDESPEQRRNGAVAAGAKGDAARVLVPEVAAALGRDNVVGLACIAKAMRELGAEHEALLVVRARMVRAEGGDLRECMKALGELGEIARDDVATHTPRLLEDGGEFDCVTTFDALRATGADPAPYRDAVATSLSRWACDRGAAADLLCTSPKLALEMRDDLVRALPDGERHGGRSVVDALLAAGGLPPDETLRLLDTVEPIRVSRVLDAIGPESACPDDDVALRLWGFVLASERYSDASDALDALKRADAVDARDIPRLLRAVEERELGSYSLAELCRKSTFALPRLLYLFERGHDVAWPLAMFGPRAEAALPRLVLEARDQDSTAANAVGAIGAAGVEPLRVVLEGQHDVLRQEVLFEVIWGVHETAEERTAAQVDAACRGYLALLVDVAPEDLDPHLPALTAHADEDVRWAAEVLTASGGDD